jgi:hypothetical protein
MKKILTATVCLLLTCVPCFAQSTFEGLTPGHSTRAEVERVLGLPVKRVSETLVEYAPRRLKLSHAEAELNSGKIYVQYRDASPAAVVERIELLLCARSTRINDECNVSAMHTEYDRGPSPSTSSGGSLDAYLRVRASDGDKTTWYFGSPRYMVRTDIDKPSGSEVRWAFYSKELYEGIAPGGNCTGMLRGEWDTNRGRTTFTRGVEYGQVRGTYSEGHGTFTGEQSGAGNISGEWKDNTGSGTMFLQLYYPGANQFTGSWERTSGTGPAKGTWEGRCVESQGGNH